MRIIVPYTFLPDEVVKSFDRPWLAYPIDPTDDEAYYRLLHRLWFEAEPFILSEHDIVQRPEVLDEIWAHSRWCSYPYNYVANPANHGLACAFFSRELMRAHPNALMKVGRMHDPQHPPKFWCRLDQWLTMTLTAAGESRCEHVGTPLVHLNGSTSRHGCYWDPADRMTED